MTSVAFPNACLVLHFALTVNWNCHFHPVCGPSQPPVHFAPLLSVAQDSALRYTEVSHFDRKEESV